MHERTSAGAAGVSPPWCEHHDNRHNAIATGEFAPCKRTAQCQPGVVEETHLQERCRKVAGDCRRCAHERRCSRGSEPTGGLRPPLLTAQMFAVADRCLRLENTSRDYPRGAYAPRSCVRVQTSAGEITIFAMHERTSAGAAGVSPPWFEDHDNGHNATGTDELAPCKRTAQCQPAVVRIRACNGYRFCGLITFRPAYSLPIPRLAHASRSCCRVRVG
jgi:hypothetical protein